MDLYSITVLFRGSPNVARLMFKGADSAQESLDAICNAVESIPPGTVTVKDDYSKVLFVDGNGVGAASLAHINEELNAAADEQILQAHGQIKLQKRAKADPEIAAENRSPTQIWQPG